MRYIHPQGPEAQAAFSQGLALGAENARIEDLVRAAGVKTTAQEKALRTSGGFNPNAGIGFDDSDDDDDDTDDEVDGDEVAARPKKPTDAKAKKKAKTKGAKKKAKPKSLAAINRAVDRLLASSTTRAKVRSEISDPLLAAFVGATNAEAVEKRRSRAAVDGKWKGRLDARGDASSGGPSSIVPAAVAYPSMFGGAK